MIKDLIKEDIIKGKRSSKQKAQKAPKVQTNFHHFNNSEGSFGINNETMYMFLPSTLTPSDQYQLTNETMSFSMEASCGAYNQDTFPVFIDPENKIVVPVIIKKKD